MVYYTKKQTDNSVNRYDKSQKQTSQLSETGKFSVSNNIQAEYDMWSWIYQEIANIRIRVNQLGMIVRLNNSNSPDYLEAYHADIYSLLLPISVIINDSTWKEIETMWLELKVDINEYLKQRGVIRNKKIPFELIRKLDKLYRIAILVAQKGGLGIKITTNLDFEKSIENMIAGD